MLTELNSLSAPSPVRAASGDRPAAAPRAPGGSAAGRRVAADPLTRQAVEPAQLLDRASRAAARAMFKDRDVEITSYRTRAPGGRSIA